MRVQLVGSMVLLCVLSLAACGGPQRVHPACVEDYDQCINMCAYRCDDGSVDITTDYGAEPGTVNTWDSDCQQCSAQCDHVADQCSQRHQDEELPD